MALTVRHPTRRPVAPLAVSDCVSPPPPSPSLSFALVALFYPQVPALVHLSSAPTPCCCCIPPRRRTHTFLVVVRCGAHTTHTHTRRGRMTPTMTTAIDGQRKPVPPVAMHAPWQGTLRSLRTRPRTLGNSQLGAVVRQPHTVLTCEEPPPETHAPALPHTCPPTALRHIAWGGPREHHIPRWCTLPVTHSTGTLWVSCLTTTSAGVHRRPARRWREHQQ